MRTRVHHYQSFAALILFLFLAFGGREIQAQTDSSCNREGSSRSAQTTQAAKLILTNQTSETLTVYWLDFEGKRQKWFDLSAGQAFEQSTFVGHLWLVTKPNGQCLAIFSAPGNFVIGKPQSPVNTNRPKQPQNQSTALPSTSGSSAESYFAQGNKYREAKNYAAAVEAYKKSISLRQSIGAYGALGLVYLEDLKQYEKALDAFQQAIRLKPDDAQLRLNLGITYVYMKQYENAVGPLREAIRLKPDNPSGFAILGNAYAQIEQFPEALAAYQQAIRLAPKNAVYHGNLGIAYVEMGRKEEALQVLKTLQRLDPAKAKELAEDIDLIEGNDPNALLNLGMSMALKPQNHWLALRLFRRVIVMNRDPKSVGDAYYQIGSHYEFQRKMNEKATTAYKQAVAFYQQAIQVKPDAEALLFLGYSYLGLGRKQDAQQVYSRLQRVDREKAQKLSEAINKMK